MGPPSPRRHRFIQMDDLLDAMATNRPGAPTFYLDVETGRIELGLGREGGGPSPDPDPDRYPQIPRGKKGATRALLLKQALAWLSSLRILPQYELRPAAGKMTRPRKTGKEIGFLDLLLLGGAPADASERRHGRVERRLLAPTRAEARATFLRIARELCRHHARPWRSRAVQALRRYEVERFTLTISDREVLLSIAVPAALWEVFHPRAES
jgi:hypothetical protein